MRKLTIAGYIGADAQVADLPSGMQVINFNVAVSEKIKDTSDYKTTWFRCARFSNNVSIAPYLKKGTFVIVEGKPDIETYVDQQGVTKANLKCIVSEIHFGGNSKNDESANTTSEPQKQPTERPYNTFVDEPKDSNLTEEEDQLPF